MYNLLEYSSNYSDMTGSLCFYSKNESTNFNVDTEDNVAFKFLRYTEVQRAPNNNNGPSKNLRTFWRSFEILMINCKVDLKLKWKQYFFLAPAGNNNTNDNGDNIILNIKDIKLYVPVVTLSAKGNQKLSKLLSKILERSVYWNEYNTKSENKNTTNEHSSFLESNFVGVNKLFDLIYLNQDDNSKRYKAKRYYFQKVLSKIITSSSTAKTFLTNPLILR